MAGRTSFRLTVALFGAVIFGLTPEFAIAQLVTSDASASLEASTSCLAFMNITTNVAETGFYQILCVSNDITAIRIQSVTEINKIDLLDNTRYVFNGTFPFSRYTLTSNFSATSKDGYDRFGILSSTQRTTSCYGVKSDRGTTDGFMALPLTTKSTSFFISSWQWTIPDFFCGFQVVAALPDTCVTIWSIDSKGVYSKVLVKYMNEDYGVWLFQGNIAVPGTYTPLSDTTGLFVNSSKPIGVIAGCSCAFIPNDQTMFCDYIAEQIQPVSELGVEHLVPPIYGRSSTAGYVVRVVAANPTTTVTWKTSDVVTSSGSTIINPGGFIQLNISNNYLATLVICSKPCLVMQYNTGRRSGQINRADDVPSDPFMMNIAPVERFDNQSCFATASMDFDINWTVDFDNYAVIVTKGSTSTIFVDGQPVVNGWTQVLGTYWMLILPSIKHGSHCISVTAGSGTLFGAYVYGHSVMNTSSSAYGYTAAFQVSGTLVQSIWQQAQVAIQKEAAASLNATCNQLPVYSGSLIVKYPTQSKPQTITYPISLSAKVTSAPMTLTCINQYQTALTNNLINVAQLINFLICNGTLCPYLTGPDGTGAPLNASAVGVYNQVMYVAIDVNSIANGGVTISYDASSFAISGVSIQLLYTGILDTTSETYTRCRNDIRNYLYPFSNWPYGNALFPVLPSPCKPIITQSPFQFNSNNVCPSGFGS